MTSKKLSNNSQKKLAKNRYENEYINFNNDDQMEIYGYKKHMGKSFLTWILIILTALILKLIFHWKPHWKLYFTNKRCSQTEAETVLLKDKYEQIFTEKVILYESNKSDTEYIILKENARFESTNSLRYFTNKKIRYLWDSNSKQFLKLNGLDFNIFCSVFRQQNGLTIPEQNRRANLFGENIIEIKVQSIIQILFSEILGPFYIFQAFAIILWCLEDYYYYAAYILLMSIISLFMSSFQIRRNQRQLKDAVKGEDVIEVWRGGDIYENIATTKLVPGDVIVVPSNGQEMHCDAVIISGNVIVDESMLTGESVPVTKVPIPSTDALFNIKHHFKHILFSGTKIIQTRFYGEEKVKAVVIRTGFQTTKGELVRSIMFPKPMDFKFNRHIHIFIFVMACIAMIGFIYTIVLKANRNDSIGDIFLKALDLITIVVPPELPAALTISTIFVDNRLRKSQIFCISPKSINISGCIDCVCFDKTGTLTEDDLSLAELLPSNLINKEFESPLPTAASLQLCPLLVCLATCHELTIIDDRIVGDPLDIKMFESTEWLLEEPKVNDTNKFDLLRPTIAKPLYVKDETQEPQIGILRQFPFSSNLSRMSVITRKLNDDHFELYSKGAPEIIETLCDPKSIPTNFHQVLTQYTKKSYRVIAVAYRSLPDMDYAEVQRAQREDIENNLSFLGFVVMRNLLKPETIDTIKSLHTANIRTLMATGDNILTGLSVAQECHMIDKNDKIAIIESYEDSEHVHRLKLNFIDYSEENLINRKDGTENGVNNNFINLSINEKIHFAMTGHTFKIINDYYPELIPKIVVLGTVFARMSPELKQLLIESLQNVGYYVGMVGDGANDCGALKSAHAGISLSDTEASVASPFTSKNPNISCVLFLIREGRASLVSVFGIVKYMACYNLTAFLAIIILYTLHSNLTDIQNLYQDLFIISLYIIFFGRTHAYPKLSPTPPSKSLIGLTQLSSMVLQLVIVFIFQMSALLLLWQQKWYEKHESTDDDYDYKCHDNYAMFAIQVVQYITLVIVFSKGAPFRRALHTNGLLLLSIIITTIITLYIIISPELPRKWISNFFEIQYINFTYEFRLIIVGLIALNFICALTVEQFIVEKLIVKLSTIISKDTEFKKIENESLDTEWTEYFKAIKSKIN